MLHIFVLLISQVLSSSERYRDNLPCAYSFHVWNPGNDIVQKVKDVNYKVENITGYIDRQFLKMKTSMMEELKQCHNWTINLERDINDMKFKTLKGRIIERDTSNSITDVERDILDLKKKVSHIKNNFQRMQRNLHSSNMANIQRTEPMSQSDKKLLNTLKNLVRDLKAEWVVLKRDVIDLQTEHMDMKSGQNFYSNNSFHLSKSLKSLMSKVSYLEKRNENFTSMLKLQSDVQNNCHDEIKNFEVTDVKLAEITSSIKNDVAEHNEKIAILNNDFGLLKDDNAYMKKIVLASLKNSEVQFDAKQTIKRTLDKGFPKGM